MKRVYGIEDDTGTDLWRKSINKEMLKVKVAYAEKKEIPEKIPSGKAKIYISFQEVPCNLIFYVKTDFSRNARKVSNRAMAEAPSRLTNFYVLSRDSVHLDFFIAQIHDLDIIACGVGNKYLNAPCREKIWVLAGPEHGLEKTSKIMVIVRELYGLKSSGEACRTLRDMNFVLPVADTGVYCR